MTISRQTFDKVQRIKDVLTLWATDGKGPELGAEYSILRQELMTEPEIREELPEVVRNHRTLDEFWNFIKHRFAHWKERRDYLQGEFSDIFYFIESRIYSEESPVEESIQLAGLFLQQFPAGLPFGRAKPHLAVTPTRGIQEVIFEQAPDIGVIRNNIYPNFSYSSLIQQLDKQPFVKGDLYRSLLGAIQTPLERKFFMRYSALFNMRDNNVPVLVPQAWIQWHSKTKADLRSQQSSYADDLYRVDFVAFWQNRRFAILVDDIGHYAEQQAGKWIANETLYSKRLKEDRKLRKEGWQVFRVSNWEMRDDNHLADSLSDLQNFIDF